MELTNPWVWTQLTESIYPDRKAGTPVHLGYLMKGYKEYYPYNEWIKKGYVERNNNKLSITKVTKEGEE